MRNYFDYWYKRTIKDGLKAMKLVIGIGLSFSLGIYINIGVGILMMGFILIEGLIDRN